jgi:hypothetical protein
VYRANSTLNAVSSVMNIVALADWVAQRAVSDGVS